MKRSLAILLALVLLVALAVAPVSAAKKKKKKPKLVRSELTLYLRWGPGSSDCDGPKYLSSQKGENPGQGCAFTFQAAQEVLTASGQGTLTNDWSAEGKDVPFQLDASRPLTGTIAIRGAAAPQAHLELGFSGTVKNQVKDLASYTSDNYTMVASGQTGPQTIEFEVPVGDKKLNKKKFNGFTLSTAIRGLQANGYIDLDAPSFVTVPVWVKKR